MTVLAAGLAASAVVVLLSGPAVARSRLARLAAGQAERPPGSWRRRRGTLSSAWLASSVVAAALALLVGGVVGLAVGVLAGAAAWHWLRRLEPLAERRRREQIEDALPVAAEILASCVLAGATAHDALAVAADVVEGPVGEALRDVEHRLRLGADPRTAWTAADARVTATLGRSVVRALDSGAPVVDGLLRASERLRQERQAARRDSARSVGVRAAAPLGLCFLPAFILIGVAPIVVSFAQSLAPALP